MITRFNVFRSKLKGSGLSLTQVSQLWKKYPHEITDLDLTTDKIQYLHNKVPKIKKVKRVSLIKRVKMTPKSKKVIAKRVSLVESTSPTPSDVLNITKPKKYPKNEISKLKVNGNYNEYFKLLTILEASGFTEASKEIDEALDEKLHLKQIYDPELMIFYDKMGSIPPAQNYNLELSHFNDKIKSDSAFWYFYQWKNIRYLKALLHKKQNEFNEYFKILTLNSDYEHDESDVELEKAYSEKLELKQKISSKLIEYYQDRVKSSEYNNFSDDHLRKIEDMILEIEDMAPKYIPKNIPKAIELYEKAIKMGSKTSLGHLGYLYDIDGKEFINKEKAVSLYEQSIKINCLVDEYGSGARSLNDLATLFSNKNGYKILKKYIKEKCEIEYKNEHKIGELELEILKLKEQVTHLTYCPPDGKNIGGPGYESCKRDFERLKVLTK